MKEPTFAADTPYDRAAYAALARLMIRKLRRWPRLALLITGAVSVAASGYVMIAGGRISPAALLFLLLGNLTLMIGLLAERFAQRLLSASNRKGEIPRFHYEFGADMCVTGAKIEKTYGYGEIARAFETGEYLFFFMRDGQTYILRQDSLTRGDYPSLRTFLNAKMGGI